MRASGRQKIRQLFHGRGRRRGGLTRWLPSLSDPLIIGTIGMELYGVCDTGCAARNSAPDRHAQPINGIRATLPADGPDMAADPRWTCSAAAGRLRPPPGRVFIVGPAHTFEQFAHAINAAFARWDLSHLHQFELADGG